MQNISQNVQVAVRIRNIQDDIRKCAVAENPTSKNEFQSIAISDPEGRKGKKIFTYDRIFSSDDNQETVYQVVHPIIERCLDGYNGCIFAYGQTSSGKTYTMEGVGGDLRGVIPRVAEQIIDHIENNARQVDNEGIDYSIHGSYLEIYQEQLRDLLNNGDDAVDLRIRMDPLSITGKELCVEGLTERPLKTSKDFLKLIQIGSKNRTVAETNMNKVSSRSHAVLTLTIDQIIRRPKGKSDVLTEPSASPKKRSKIHLIDLAGSERADSTGATGTRLKEGSMINVSLSSLGNVINALSAKSSHIPYRDSKLTYLLSDSLGGNSLTLVLACLSPSSSCYEESVGTLRFAERAKKVQNNARVNLDPASLKIMELEAEIKRLRDLLSRCICGRIDKLDIHPKKLVWYKRLWAKVTCKGDERGVITPTNDNTETLVIKKYQKVSQITLDVDSDKSNNHQQMYTPYTYDDSPKVNQKRKQKK